MDVFHFHKKERAANTEDTDQNCAKFVAKDAGEQVSKAEYRHAGGGQEETEPKCVDYGIVKTGLMA